MTATNGKEAIRLVKKKIPEVVILDIMMPELDGIQTLKRIRRFNKKLPVFMLTDYGDEKKLATTTKLGISGFIQKGTKFGKASDLVRVALRGQK